MFPADLHQPLQLGAAPYPGDRIVGSAEYQQAGAIVDFLFQLIEVHRVALSLEVQGVLHHPALVVDDRFPEGVVHRRLDDDPVADLGIGE